MQQTGKGRRWCIGSSGAGRSGGQKQRCAGTGKCREQHCGIWFVRGQSSCINSTCKYFFFIIYQILKFSPIHAVYYVIFAAVSERTISFFHVRFIHPHFSGQRESGPKCSSVLHFTFRRMIQDSQMPLFTEHLSMYRVHPSVYFRRSLVSDTLANRNWRACVAASYSFVSSYLTFKTEKGFDASLLDLVWFST